MAQIQLSGIAGTLTDECGASSESRLPIVYVLKAFQNCRQYGSIGSWSIIAQDAILKCGRHEQMCYVEAFRNSGTNPLTMELL